MKVLWEKDQLKIYFLKQLVLRTLRCGIFGLQISKIHRIVKVIATSQTILNFNQYCTRLTATYHYDNI